MITLLIVPHYKDRNFKYTIWSIKYSIITEQTFQYGNN